MNKRVVVVSILLGILTTSFVEATFGGKKHENQKKEKQKKQKRKKRGSSSDNLIIGEPTNFRDPSNFTDNKDSSHPVTITRSRSLYNPQQPEPLVSPNSPLDLSSLSPSEYTQYLQNIGSFEKESKKRHLSRTLTKAKPGSLEELALQVTLFKVNSEKTLEVSKKLQEWWNKKESKSNDTQIVLDGLFLNADSFLDPSKDSSAIWDTLSILAKQRGSIVESNQPAFFEFFEYLEPEKDYSDIKVAEEASKLLQPFETRFPKNQKKLEDYDEVRSLIELGQLEDNFPLFVKFFGYKPIAEDDLEYILRVALDANRSDWLPVVFQHDLFGKDPVFPQTKKGKFLFKDGVDSQLVQGAIDRLLKTKEDKKYYLPIFYSLLSTAIKRNNPELVKELASLGINGRTLGKYINQCVVEKPISIMETPFVLAAKVAAASKNNSSGVVSGLKKAGFKVNDSFNILSSLILLNEQKVEEKSSRPCFKTILDMLIERNKCNHLDDDTRKESAALAAWLRTQKAKTYNGTLTPSKPDADYPILLSYPTAAALNKDLRPHVKITDRSLPKFYAMLTKEQRSSLDALYINNNDMRLLLEICANNSVGFTQRQCLMDRLKNKKNNRAQQICKVLEQKNSDSNQLVTTIKNSLGKERNAQFVYLVQVLNDSEESAKKLSNHLLLLLSDQKTDIPKKLKITKEQLATTIDHILGDDAQKVLAGELLNRKDFKQRRLSIVENREVDEFLKPVNDDWQNKGHTRDLSSGTNALNDLLIQHQQTFNDNKYNKTHKRTYSGLTELFKNNDQK